LPERAAVNDLEDVVKEFLVESYENLDRLDRDLVVLEQDPSSEPTLSSIFRTIHTIKGTCGFFGFGKLQCVAHVGENLLSKLREGQLLLRPEITTAMLGLVDAIREILANIENSGAEGEADYGELVQTLIELQGGPLEDIFAPTSLDKQSTAAEAPNSNDTPVDDEKPGDSQSSDIQDSDPRPAPARSGIASTTIRVDVGSLDELMNGISELVLARNQILQWMHAKSDTSLAGAAQRLSTITTELQQGVMRMRLQPISHLWSKLPRVVRDLAQQCGKEVQLQLEGAETELDKTVIESIKDPLMHLVRNAVDHGIELPAVRLAAGKAAAGRLALSAVHDAGQVHIEISDDGSGLNLPLIRQKAVERGLIERDQAQRMTDREVAQLIFAPGFSTAGEVTNISGRGVGMDVVKTNLEKIGGTIDLETRPGEGTTIRLNLPLTLAIMPALMVTCDGAAYAIPQASLQELVRVDAAKADGAIERLYSANVFRLRGELLPIVYLRQELGCESTNAPAKETGQPLNILVLRAAGRLFGLIVDAIRDMQEIVVQPLSRELNGTSAYAGATIMGDGRVALILDVPALARRARVTSGDERQPRHAVEDAREAGNVARQRLLIAEAGNRRLAIPLSQVARLEEFPPELIEQSHGREAIQYRGQIMPLMRMDKVLGIANKEASARPLKVLVYQRHDCQLGVAVDQIGDIVEVPIEADELDLSHAAKSIVVQGRVTDLIDLDALADRSLPERHADSRVAEGAKA
jgi:two-component system chemotaxis sensor kinase CheA